MNKDDWYRNEVWNKSIEKYFNDKLKRVRLKQDYLRIQASYLADNEPDVALGLLERYFNLGVHFDVAHAWCDRARAFRSMGKTNHALEAFFMALKEEESNPGRLTQAYLSLPVLVADEAVASWYSAALDILDRHTYRLASYRDYFKWNAARAIILSDKGCDTEAVKFALDAIQAKQDQEYGFMHHFNAGTMDSDDRHKNLYNKITLIAIYGKPSLRDRVSRMFGS